MNTYGQVAMSDVAQCKLTGGGRLVYWGTTPLPGPTGAVGPAGPTGAMGPTGPAGVAGSLATTSMTLAATSTTHIGSLGIVNGVYLQANCIDQGTPTASVTVGNFTGGDLHVVRDGSPTVYTILDHQGLDLVVNDQSTLTSHGALGPFTAIVMAIPVAGTGCVFTVAH